MFLYRTSKAMIWGQAYRPKNSVEGKEPMDAFVEKYFDRIEPDGQEGNWTTYKVNWKATALPNARWPEQFLKPESKHLRLIMFILMGDRIGFPLGILFPIPLQDPVSYNFLKQFSLDTPFKMNAQYFKVVVPIGKKGRYAARNAEAEIQARLAEVIP